MGQTIGYVSIVVRDYDEAVDFYTRCLGFTVVEDKPLEGDQRWVVVAPRESGGTALLLARGVGQKQLSRVGDQTGARVFLFLLTDDFWGDYGDMQSRGVVFREEPREEAYGIVAVFQDLYGNRWDLLQPAVA